MATPELVDPIHAACGPGKVIKVEGMESAAASDSQRKVTDRANAMRALQDRYGLDARQAERALDWLDARGEANRRTTPDGILEPPITGAMMVEMPPRPVMDPSECPPGSSLSSGLCRTPEGYLRPLPDWLVEFLEQDP